MTVKLCDCVIPIYNEICSNQKGRITLTKLVLDDICFMSHGIINTLKNFFEFLESEVLTHIQGKNVSLNTKSCMPLDKIGAFSDETYGDIHRGFTKCINEDFKTVITF